jgi:hypothetical protein
MIAILHRNDDSKESTDLGQVFLLMGFRPEAYVHRQSPVFCRDLQDKHVAMS